ncbi:Fe-S cluster assembly protein SufD [Echinicola sp. CAU 1574]|uniref:Fe-S cluster assembly protein SufD n=1 Tax=Echinicola arenosa TaxID=2774144 RepID=A0ABR9AP59_9BACT|nr:Fe-S cluster assembly protein SufD [Echinicola arenosa]MBD8490574.1 Fe-S cluster assembly protein SufD [Echinicola arenosa]
MTTLTKNKIKDSFLEIIAKATSENFSEIKQQAVEFLQKEGLPAAKAEEYKFTPLSKKLESLTNLTSATQINLSAEAVKSELIPDLEVDYLVFNNGNFDKELSSYTEKNYSVKSFKSLSEEETTKIGSIAKVSKDPFTALNTAFFQDGIYIHIAKGKVVERPILILNFNQANNGQVISPRIYVQGESNAEATFIEKVISLNDEAYFLNGVTEVKVGENAHLNYYKIQNESTTAIEANNFVSDVHRDATFTSVTLSLKGDMIRNNLSLNLLDSGCEGNMYGLYLLDGKTHVDNHTNVDHTMPHADSNELYKGILAEKSRGVFNGKIFVRQDAQKTNAFQQNNNILLSDDAIINTKPQLEIWADDVKCSHGCTTGQLDEEALFYLQARGIGKDQAKGLLLYAFAGEIMDHIKIDAFKEYCITLVQERLGKL